MKLRMIALPALLTLGMIVTVLTTQAQATGADQAAAAPAVVTSTGHSFAWTDVSPPPVSVDKTSIAADSRNTAWLAAGDQLTRTTDGGKTWSTPSTEFPGFTVFASPTSSRASVAVPSDTVGPSTIYSTDNGGTTWTTAWTGKTNNEYIRCMSFWPGGKNGIAIGQVLRNYQRANVYRTTDFGSSWHLLTHVSQMPVSGDCLSTPTSNVAFALGAQPTDCSCNNVTVYRSTDAGATWQPFETPVRASNFNEWSSAVKFRDAETGIVTGYLTGQTPWQALVTTTTDGADSWTPVSFPAGLNGLQLLSTEAAWLNPTLPDVVMVSQYFSALSTDQGQTWTQIDSGVQWSSVDCTNDGACWASGLTDNVDGYAHVPLVGRAIYGAVH